jgi:Protein of unknown function (DUF2782)
MRRYLKFALLLISMLPMLAIAADKPRPDNLEPLEEVQPPPNTLEENATNATIEGESEPQITIRKKGKDTVEEYRINGQLYMQKITPEHGVPYYLHREDQDGGWVNDGPNQPLIIPKWVIFRF